MNRQQTDRPVKLLTFQIASGHVECRWADRVFDIRYGDVPGYTGPRWLLLEDGFRPLDWAGTEPIVEKTKQAMFERIEREMGRLKG